MAPHPSGTPLPPPRSQPQAACRSRRPFARHCRQPQPRECATPGLSPAGGDVDHVPMLRNACPAQLLRLAEALSSNSDNGAALGTLKKDDRAWLLWNRFPLIVGFDPVVSPEQARTSPGVLTGLLASFLLFVHSQLAGRRAPTPKPQYSFAYPLAIIRVLKRWGVAVPSAGALKHTLAGLMRTYVNVYGKDVLSPQRRQPFLFAMLRRICELQRHTIVAGVAWEPVADNLNRVGLTPLKVMWRTGHWLEEAVRTSDELTYFVRADVTYRIGGRVIVDAAHARTARPHATRRCSVPRSVALED
eukprot:2735348-Pleurochrysis_carterae.AAC.2